MTLPAAPPPPDFRVPTSGSAAAAPLPYAPPHPMPPRRTNGLAIAAFVLSIPGLLVVSVILAIVALVQTKRSGEKGRGLAIAALSISGAWVVIFPIAFILALIAFSAVVDVHRDANGEIVEAGDLSISELQVGDCIESVSEEEVITLRGVPCAQPHEAEVYAIFDMPSRTYPSDEAVGDECAQRLESYSELAWNAPSIEIYYLSPDSETWRHGDREVICFAVDEDGRTGSIRD
jgi:hypothetical protein